MPSLAVAQEPVDVPGEPCATITLQTTHLKEVQRVYRKKRVRPSDREMLRELRRCANSTQAQRNMRAAERDEREWRKYRQHPMPRCTWVNESGNARISEYASIRYRASSRRSTADGKYQILSSTWAAYGGLAFAATALKARPLEQERVARRIMWTGHGPHKPQGQGAWVNC